jgi:DNA-directed RNA polymerase subunit RPC12/RpoP|tara:strand:+ start:2183 stop:2344 length:162 start_codon:yes stop_codon:yes gene_type:complete
MTIEIVCGKCGKNIGTMKMLKSIKDLMKHYNNKCPNCGQKISPVDFSTEVEHK